MFTELHMYHSKPSEDICGTRQELSYKFMNWIEQFAFSYFSQLIDSGKFKENSPRSLLGLSIKKCKLIRLYCLIRPI